MRGIIVLEWLWTTLWLYAYPPYFDKVLDDIGLPKEDISLYIAPISPPDETLISSYDTVKRTPASVIKLFTTYAALLELGFEYQWPTRFYISGAIENGTLYGDLIIKGYGDPTFSSNALSTIVTKLYQAGIHHIQGNIVIDRSYFHTGNQNSSYFDEYIHSPYNAMPDAMMFNERISTICVTPNQNRVTKENPDQSYIIYNQLQHVNKPCNGRYAWPKVKVEDEGDTPVVWLRGKISKRCGIRKICKVVTKPYLSFYYALLAALKSKGVEVEGKLHLHRVSSGSRLLFTYYSEPLESIIAKTAKESNNLYARHLLLLLGAKHYGPPATVTKGRKAVVEILRTHGVLGSEKIDIDNGSGLSRHARLSATALVRLLTHAYQHYGKRWMEVLSIAGIDGTIKQRFQGSIVEGHAWMKTGTLKHVKNIAGYVEGRDGTLYVTVILVNTAKERWKASKLQDEFIKWLAKSNTNQPLIPSISPPLSKSKDYVTGKSLFFIQAGSFRYEPAPAYLSQLRSFDLPIVIEHEKEYKVRIGPYEDEAKAREMLHYVKSHINRNAFLVQKQTP